MKSGDEVEGTVEMGRCMGDKGKEGKRVKGKGGSFEGRERILLSLFPFILPPFTWFRD
jgi:hypothetical protein